MIIKMQKANFEILVEMSKSLNSSGHKFKKW